MTRRLADPPDEAARTRARRLTLAAAILLAANLALLIVAVLRSDAIIRDGAANVTTGNVVAWGILLTLLAVVLVPLARLPRDVERHVQVFALGAQALHATGHLAGFYYAFPNYDDLLHAGVTAWLALLALSVARAWRIIPKRQVTPLRAALVVVFAGVALAGAWEIFEYSTDAALGSREQDNLDDTMQDMIAGGVGTLFAAAWAHRGVKRARTLEATRQHHLGEAKAEAEAKAKGGGD